MFENIIFSLDVLWFHNHVARYVFAFTYSTCFFPTQDLEPFFFSNLEIPWPSSLQILPLTIFSVVLLSVALIDR